MTVEQKRTHFQHCHSTTVHSEPITLNDVQKFTALPYPTDHQQTVKQYFSIKTLFNQATVF